MSEFLYVFRGGMAEGSPEQMQQHMQKWGVWLKQLQDSGTFKAGNPLDKGGKVVSQKNVVDGPFAEAKDAVGGYLLVETKDIAHAVEVSKGCPILQAGGTVEVRPVAKLSM
jgi:hypothetical protein